MKGKRVLFPFSFHCTGMPIAAAAKKLLAEYENGSDDDELDWLPTSITTFKDSCDHCTGHKRGRHKRRDLQLGGCNRKKKLFEEKKPY